MGSWSLDTVDRANLVSPNPQTIPNLTGRTKNPELEVDGVGFTELLEHKW